MKLEPLRIRILDALEARPMGITEIARATVSTEWNVRPAVKQLLEANMIEQIDRRHIATDLPAQSKIYAIKGAVREETHA